MSVGRELKLAPSILSADFNILGQQMDIMRANYAFMGLSLNAGHHDIEFRYHLPYLKEGLLLSGISLGLTLIVIVLTKKKRRE